MRLPTPIMELLNGGDWACAYGQHETLAQVGRELSQLVAEDQAARARAVEHWALIDLRIASRIWAELARDLRYGAAPAASHP